MTIGHYAPALWAPGGIAAYVRRLASGQAAAGHAVRTFSLAPLADVAPAGHLVVENEAALFDAARALRLDVLHLHKSVAALPAGRVPTIRTMHGHQGSCPSATRFLARTGRPCDREASLAVCTAGRLVDRCGSRHPLRLLAGLDGVRHERALGAELHTVAVSGYLKSAMVRAGFDSSRVHALLSPAPTAPPYTPPPPGPPRVVFLGRLVPQKGAAWLLDALAHVPGLALDIAGEGPDEAALRVQMIRLGLADRVTFHGWLQPGAARALVLGARAVVVPSVWHEPAGLVTLEAAACGRAVVASRVGGIPEYAAADAALLVEPGDVPGLASALRLLAADAALAGRLGRAGRARTLAHHAMADFVRRQDALYALAGAPAPVSAHSVPALPA